MIQNFEIMSLDGDVFTIGGYAYIDGLDCSDSRKQLQFVDKSGTVAATVELETQIRLDLSREDPTSVPDYSPSGFRTVAIVLTDVLSDGDYQLRIVVHEVDATASANVEVRGLAERARVKLSTTKTHSIVPYVINDGLHIILRQDGPLRRSVTRLHRTATDLKREAALLIRQRRWKAFLIMQLYRVSQAYLRRKHLWIVGERCNTAQDNGYWLYKYIQENKLVKNCYYPIDKKSPERQAVAKLGRVIDHGSIRHILYLLCCEKNINTHITKKSMLPLEFKRVLKYHPEWEHGHRIFLQHGVASFGWWGASMVKNHTRLAMMSVSSKREQDYLSLELAYDRNELPIVGLTRWDQLIDCGTGKTILLMPTWRRWIGSSTELLESEYYHQLISLLSNAELHSILEKYDLRLLFHPHFEIQQYWSSFPEIHPSIQFIRQGEQTVHWLLQSSDLLITDYSSVSFDFLYMHKPVVFYQFDSDMFYSEHYQPGLITRDNMFGNLAISEDEVVNCVQKFADKDVTFMSSADDKQYIVRYPGEHCRLTFEAICAH